MKAQVFPTPSEYSTEVLSAIPQRTAETGLDDRAMGTTAVMTLRIAPEVVAAEVPPEGTAQLLGAKALFGLGVCVFEALTLGLAFGAWGVYAALLTGVLAA